MLKSKFSFLLFSSFLLIACAGQVAVREKVNGISFVAPPREFPEENLEPFLETNANWAAVMPFGFMPKIDSTAVIFNVERQWWGERREGALKTTTMLKERGIKVMLKPQLWVWRGDFTGHIKMKTEADWLKFEESYENFILFYAQLAQESHAEMFCIGTELSGFVAERPAFWHQLIPKIRKIYSGKLTYAENWDTFNQVPFWKELDFVGIDAYFPVSDSETPTVAEARKGWQPHKRKIHELGKQVKKPILFTEFGYRNTHFSGKEPWNAQRTEGNINHEAQLNLITALFEEFWHEPWFSGGFLWKWFPNHEQSGGDTDNQFTVQNKPAQAVIAQWFGRQ